MGIEVVRTVAELRAACSRLRDAGESVGLVPTMGALHAGHASLIRAAAKRTSAVVVTVFVNPTQFGPSEDFSRYPRTLDEDVVVSEAAGARVVFAPSETEMYPEGEATRVRVDRLTDHLCGRSRPGHFEGVTTIVAKLFAVVGGPTTAVFGRKDYQQLKVIERMTKDLLLPVTIVGAPTVREPDGLALSSRNAYLAADEREAARVIPLALSEAVAAFATGERNVGKLRGAAEARIAAGGLRVDYVCIADADTLEPLADEAVTGERALLAQASYCGKARLIDNVVFGEDPAPIPGVAP